MKYIKIYEDIIGITFNDDENHNINENQITDCGWFIEVQIKNKNFYDWEFDLVYVIQFNMFDILSVDYLFYYDINSENKEVNEWLEKQKFEYECDIGKHSNSYKDFFMYKINIPTKKILEYSELYREIIKYNL